MAHRAVIFATAQLSCYLAYRLPGTTQVLDYVKYASVGLSDTRDTTAQRRSVIGLYTTET